MLGNHLLELQEMTCFHLAYGIRKEEQFPWPTGRPQKIEMSNRLDGAVIWFASKERFVELVY